MYNRIRHYSCTPYPAVQLKVLDTLEQLRSINQRSPTIIELSRHIGVSVELIIESLEFSCSYSEDANLRIFHSCH
ncbi:hypothetical protein [Bacillus sp. Marseille-Q3570]|uniref:hypothetical protein n=1 Tax=Bacillus sp. Marseille-Q3570 TaxID=2963522 RepID=UPI0021B70A1D|nr:hypothetical protein [Bacillus sp. Marseille-Q3570]